MNSCSAVDSAVLERRCEPSIFHGYYPFQGVDTSRPIINLIKGRCALCKETTVIARLFGTINYIRPTKLEAYSDRYPCLILFHQMASRGTNQSAKPVPSCACNKRMRWQSERDQCFCRSFIQGMCNTIMACLAPAINPLLELPLRHHFLIQELRFSGAAQQLPPCVLAN